MSKVHSSANCHSDRAKAKVIVHLGGLCPKKIFPTERSWPISIKQAGFVCLGAKQITAQPGKMLRGRLLFVLPFSLAFNAASSCDPSCRGDTGSLMEGTGAAFLTACVPSWPACQRNGVKLAEWPCSGLVLRSSSDVTGTGIDDFYLQYLMGAVGCGWA